MKRSLWRTRKAIVGLIGSLVLLATFPAPANAYPRPGITARVSVASDGAEANSHSWYQAMSADGRFVTFSGDASNLVPGDTNGTWDVFVHDRVAGATERVSLASDGAEANASSAINAISADGRYVAFLSAATNLVPGDTNGIVDVFVRDRVDGATERVSVASDGAQATQTSSPIPTSSWYPAISADGRFVAFPSNAANLVPGDTNASTDVFVHDRATGTTERVSVASGGVQATPSLMAPTSSWPALSADGRYVAFSADASNLAPGDTNGNLDVFVHDRETGTTEQVSVASDGAGGNGYSFWPAISADGRNVAFWGVASNLVPADTNGASDVFVHDRATGNTERVSVTSDGAETTRFYSHQAAISADGRYVAFSALAYDLVPGDTNQRQDVFLHDRATGATERVSLASPGTQANHDTWYPAISADGRYVTSNSYASNLAPGDTNGDWDIFVHDRGGSLGVVGTPSALKVSGGVGVSGRATFSGATLAGATDPDLDGTGAGPLGAELTGAALIYRPAQEDLLLRLDLSSLASDVVPPGLAYYGVPAGAGLPGILYGAELRVGETRYEVRALRAAATADWPGAKHVALYRCAPDCTEHAPLTGSFGTTGEHVLVSVPLSALGAVEGTELTGLRAFTAAGEATPGALLVVDEVALSSSVIPASRVELGIAPASTPEDQVAFAVQADLLAGDFSGSIPTDGLSPGGYRAWARACLGDTCGPASFKELAL